MSATLVQAVKATGNGNLATSATTFTAGNLLTITVGCDTGSGLTVSDTTHSVSATLAINAGTTNAQCVWVFFIPNITGGSTVITTANMGGSAAGGVLIVQEWSGLTTASPKDQTATGTGSSATHTSGTTGTTTQATELVFGADTVNGSGTSGPSAISNSFTLLRATAANYEDNQNTFWAVSTARKDLTSTGTTSTAWTWTNGGYTNALVTFKEATGGGGPTILLLNSIPNTLIRM